MDDDNIDSGILIASEEDLDNLFHSDNVAFDIDMLSGYNIIAGSYGLFLIALDQCVDPIEKAALDGAIDAMDDLKDCLVSCALTVYYPTIDIDYAGILLLADVMIYLCYQVGGEYMEYIDNATMVKLDEQISKIFGIDQDEAYASLFKSLGFEPVKVTLDE